MFKLELELELELELGYIFGAQKNQSSNSSMKQRNKDRRSKQAALLIREWVWSTQTDARYDGGIIWVYPFLA